MRSAIILDKIRNGYEFNLRLIIFLESDFSVNY